MRTVQKMALSGVFLALLCAGAETNAVGAARGQGLFWREKKIVWFGTSIPCGLTKTITVDGIGTVQNNYPKMVGALLGATVYNEAVGGSRLAAGWPECATKDDPYGCKGKHAFTFFSALGHTLDEKNEMLEHWDACRSLLAPGAPEKLNAETVRGYSFEKKLVEKYLTDRATVGRGDLYVFDHGFNDNWGNPAAFTNEPAFYSPKERFSYFGVMNYLIRKIYEDNPNARIVLISHYTGQYKTLIDVQNAVAKKWSVPIINLADNLSVAPLSVYTQGYWDAAGAWHDKGFSFEDKGDSTFQTNSGPVSGLPYDYVQRYLKPHRVVAGEDLNKIFPAGVWVYQAQRIPLLMKDNLHPHSGIEFNVRIARYIACQLNHALAY